MRSIRNIIINISGDFKASVRSVSAVHTNTENFDEEFIEPAHACLWYFNGVFLASLKVTINLLERRTGY